MASTATTADDDNPSKPPAKEDTPSSLPVTSRFPTIVSGHVRFTTEEAAESLERAPGFIYSALVELTPPFNRTFGHDDPWTLSARRFLTSVQATDPAALILPRRSDAKVNKISSPEELPRLIAEFKRDYAFDVQFTKKRVKFRIMLATTKNFYDTFKRGEIFRELQDNNWFITLSRLSTQGPIVAIGHLFNAHNRFANQEDIILELRQLLNPIECKDLDVIVTKPFRCYVDKLSSANNKKMEKIATRWPTIYCPEDTALQVRELIMDRWPLLQSEPEFATLNISKYKLLPADAETVPFATFVQAMAEQNNFLKDHREVTVLYNCQNMDTKFLCSNELAHTLDLPNFAEVETTLREILLTWYDSGEQVIYSIDRGNTEGSFTLLAHNKIAQRLRRDVEQLVQVMSHHPLFSTMRCAGTNGTRIPGQTFRKPHAYILSLGTYDHKYGLKEKQPESVNNTETNTTASSTVTMPPLPPKRTRQRPTHGASNHQLSEAASSHYMDVLLQKHQRTTSPSSTLTASNSSTTSQATTLTRSTTRTNNRDFVNGQVVNFKQFLTTEEFNNCLTSIISPKVNELMQPTMQQLQTMQSEVTDIKKWKEDSLTSQQNTEAAVQGIRSDINRILAKLDAPQPSPYPASMPYAQQLNYPPAVDRQSSFEAPDPKQRRTGSPMHGIHLMPPSFGYPQQYNGYSQQPSHPSPQGPTPPQPSVLPGQQHVVPPTVYASPPSPITNPTAEPESQEDSANELMEDGGEGS